MGTFHTLEIADVISGRARHDEGKHHAVLTSGTTGALDGDERWFRAAYEIGACDASLDQAGAQHSQSPVDAESDR